MRILGVTMVCIGTMIIQGNNSKLFKFCGIIVVIFGVYVQNWGSLYHA